MRTGAKPPDLSSLRKLFEDGKVWSAIGVVRAREGSGSHFRMVDGDVMVDVDLSPEGQPVWCRLGSGFGVWRVPPVGTEVGVIIDSGHIQSSPMVVCVLSSEGVDDDLDEDIMLVVGKNDVEVKAGDGKKIFLGAKSGTQPGVVGDDLTTRLETLESAVNGILGHTHSVSGGATLASTDIGDPILNPPSVKSEVVDIKK